MGHVCARCARWHESQDGLGLHCMAEEEEGLDVLNKNTEAVRCVELQEEGILVAICS